MQLIQKLRDDKKCMKKVEPSSISMAIEDIINIESFVEALVLNHYVLVRKILQSQYAIELLKKHGLDECVSMSTPMATERLDADLQGTPIDQTTYRRMIGGLMYLTASRPDLAFATFVCARYQARPTVKHLKEATRIFRYLRQSYNMGQWYPKGDSRFELIAYSDADHAGCKDDSEYVSPSACCAQVIWMRTQLLDYGYKYNRIRMYCVPRVPLLFSCNPVSTFLRRSTLISGGLESVEVRLDVYKKNEIVFKEDIKILKLDIKLRDNAFRLKNLKVVIFLVPIGNLYDTTLSMTTLADKSLLSGGDNKPPMLEKQLCDSWKSGMELYMMDRPHGRMILASIEKEAIHADCGQFKAKLYHSFKPSNRNLNAPCDQHRVAKDLWEKIKLLMQEMSR
ncbi:hypothetical protein Tco_0604703 [Tanacetum coccineum]